MTERDGRQSKGGVERAKKLSQQERSDIARRAAKARWAQGAHQGVKSHPAGRFGPEFGGEQEPPYTQGEEPGATVQHGAVTGEWNRDENITDLWWLIPREHRGANMLAMLVNKPTVPPWVELVAQEKQRRIKNLRAMIRAKLGDKELSAKRLLSIVNTWEDSGRVMHRVLEADLSHEIPDRLFTLEKELIDKYSLRFALVANISGWQAQAPDHMQQREKDDRLHHWLGVMASRVLGPVLRPGDRLGIGSGRGPYETVEALRRRNKAIPPLDLIASLTGSMDVQREDQAGVAPMDANQLVLTLAGNLPNTAHVTVPSTLTNNAGNGSKAKKVTSQNPLGFDWHASQPHVALIGIGALAGGHRLLSYDKIATLSSIVDIIEPLVEEARQFDKANEQAGYFQYACVGDLGNHLFPVPLPGQGVDSIPVSLRERIADYNDKIAAVTLDQLAEVASKGAVVAVAGGRYKAYAIRHVLCQEQPWITHLVTDDAMARWLCQA